RGLARRGWGLSVHGSHLDGAASRAARRNTRVTSTKPSGELSARIRGMPARLGFMASRKWLAARRPPSRRKARLNASDRLFKEGPSPAQLPARKYPDERILGRVILTSPAPRAGPPDTTWGKARRQSGAAGGRCAADSAMRAGMRSPGKPHRPTRFP